MAPVCTGAGFGATPLHGFPWLSHTGPSAQGPSRARPDFAGGFLGIVKGRGTAGGACSTQQRTCTQTPERKAASPPEGMLDVRAFHRRHSLRYTCHSRLHLNNKTEGHFGVGESQKENKHTGRSDPPPPPQEIHIPGKCKAAHRECTEPKLVRGGQWPPLRGLESTHRDRTSRPGPHPRRPRARGPGCPRVMAPRWAWLGPAVGQSENETPRSWQ